MLFLIKFVVALLSTGLYLSGYKTYQTKIIPPGPANFEAIFLTDETALYVFIASAIASLGISIFLVYIHHIDIKADRDMKIEQTGGSVVFLSVLIVISLFFSWPKMVLYAFVEMLIAYFIAWWLIKTKLPKP